MRGQFTAVYEPQEDGRVLAYALEVPGSRTQGKTLEEARANLAELLRLTLNSYRVNLLRKASKQARLEPIPVDLPALPSGVEEALATATGLKTRTFSREDLNQALLDEGLISEIRPPLRPEDRREEHDPIPIEGKPISEEIIEGRR